MNKEMDPREKLIFDDAKSYITEQFELWGDSPWLEGWICGVTDSVLNSANEFMYSELFDHLDKLRKGKQDEI